MDSVTKGMPSYPIDRKLFEPIKHLQWADPHFMIPSEVDIIIGSNIYERILGDERKAITRTLFARNSLFGWVISGKVPEIETSSPQVFHMSLDNQLQKFWELEEIPQVNHMSPEEKACEKFFAETTEVIDNRFVCKLPLKESITLGNSLDQAMKRFNFLERRLDLKPDLRKRYQAFIREFLDVNHIEEVPPDQLNCPPEKCFYLPHQCVFKEDSTTTKLRVIFDGSAKTTSGISINDAMMIGPVVQDDLFSIITRFRFYKIALSGDIEKMYRQVGLKEEDRDFHRLLWRDDSSMPIKHLRMTSVIYGVSCSAQLSTRCLKEVAQQTEKENVANALKHSFYVDDFLGGANLIEEAETLIQDLRSELIKYGFPLRKWSSSHPEFIQNLSTDLRAESDDLKLFSEDYKVKALGIS